VLIVGGDEVSYGTCLPEGQTYRQKILEELGDALEMSRVHFLGKVPYPVFLKMLQVSRVHVYLTYPFVLSHIAQVGGRLPRDERFGGSRAAA
jgi:hypothetical protein